MGPRGDTQSKQVRSPAPAPGAPEPTELRGRADEPSFAREAEAAAEARRRNSDQRAGAAAWITTRLATGGWALRRSQILVVSLPARPDVPRLDVPVDRAAAVEIVSPSPSLDKPSHVTRGDAADWEEAAIEHANLAGLYLSAGNPEAAARVIERARQAIAPHADERPLLTAHLLAVEARIEAALGTASPRTRNPLLDFRRR